jgi:hypothetical protein
MMYYYYLRRRWPNVLNYHYNNRLAIESLGRKKGYGSGNDLLSIQQGTVRLISDGRRLFGSIRDGQPTRIGGGGRFIGGDNSSRSRTSHNVVRSITMYTRFKEELTKQIRNDKQFQEHLRDLQQKKKEIERTHGFRRIKVSIDMCVSGRGWEQEMLRNTHKRMTSKKRRKKNIRET